MKKLLLLVLALTLALPLAFAQQSMQITGTIIDHQCAGTQTPAELTEFVKTHTKECALMASCAASGYAIFAGGKLQDFNAVSSAKVKDFLEKNDSKLQVVVEANMTDKGLDLISIKNQ